MMIGVVAGEMTMFDEAATRVAAFEVDDFVLFLFLLGTGGVLGGFGWVRWRRRRKRRRCEGRRGRGCLLGT